MTQRLGDIDIGGQWLGDEDAEEQFRLRIHSGTTNAEKRIKAHIVENGKTIKIDQENERIHVIVEEQGDKYEATYDSLNAFKTQDPKTYETYQRYLNRQSAKQTKSQKGYWEQQLRNTEKWLREAEKEIEEQLNNVQKKLHQRFKAAPPAQTAQIAQINAQKQPEEQIEFEMTDSGEIIVRLQYGDQILRQKFKNESLLQDKAPKLYKKYQALQAQLNN